MFHSLSKRFWSGQKLRKRKTERKKEIAQRKKFFCGELFRLDHRKKEYKRKPKTRTKEVTRKGNNKKKQILGTSKKRKLVDKRHVLPGRNFKHS